MPDALKLPGGSLLGAIPLCLMILGGCASTQPDTLEEQDTADSVAVDSTFPYLSDRPVPNPISHEIPPSFYRAVEKGTRTHSGEPGPRYWTQQTEYRIDVELHPSEKILTGSSAIRYVNNSPDTLNVLVLELAQNVHKEGMVRNEMTEVTGGMRIDTLVIRGSGAQESRQYFQALRDNRSSYYVEGTQMIVRPSRPLMPGSSVALNLEWEMDIPQQGAGGRMGYSQDNLFYLGYWYPKMQVYDDVNGWFTDPFRINSEFYHGFGSYELNITVPEQWIVSATGELTNAKEVLQPRIYSRLQRAHASDSVMQVAGRDDFDNVTVSPQEGKVTWSFEAENVRDVAFGVTRQSMWDAVRAPAGDRDGDGQTEYTHINAFYRSSAPQWENAARFSRHSISYLSDFTGLPYPWRHMTAVEGGGIIGGGMEFPMMTLIGSYNGQPASSLYAVIAHELAHMWVPMMVSTNERRYSWMDEGTTTFNEDNAKSDYYPDTDFKMQTFESYLGITGTGLEGPVMRWSDFHYSNAAYGTASYPKPASILFALRGLLGEELFSEAYRTFLERWQYKHPYPWDFFNTFEDVAGRDLDWFWRSWYYEAWVLDQAVGRVQSTESGTRILIEDRGEVPMPAHVRITYEDHTTETRTVAVEHWLKGNTTRLIELHNGKQVTRVEIDSERRYPDADRGNNTWQK